MWTSDFEPLRGLEPEARAVLDTLLPRTVPKGTVLFHAGDEPPGFMLVLAGRVGVYLIGQSGRDMLLYDVVSGQTCVQTTLCLLGEQAYTGEGLAETDVEFILLSRAQFASLMSISAHFRNYIFRSFGNRLKEMVALLEKVSFVKVEARLAAEILHRAGTGNDVSATHQELATAIGSVREVVSRRLESFQRNGLVQLDRGQITLVDPNALSRLSRERG